MCRQIEGYVSFANVEGLGEPGGVDEDEDEGAEEGAGGVTGSGGGGAGMKFGMGIQKLWKAWGRERESVVAC